MFSKVVGRYPKIEMRGREMDGRVLTVEFTYNEHFYNELPPIANSFLGNDSPLLFSYNASQGSPHLTN